MCGCWTAQTCVSPGNVEHTLTHTFTHSYKHTSMRTFLSASGLRSMSTLGVRMLDSTILPSPSTAAKRTPALGSRRATDSLRFCRACAHMCVRACVYTCVHVCIHVCECVYVQGLCAYVCMCVYMCASVYTCMCVHVCMCVYCVCMCV